MANVDLERGDVRDPVQILLGCVERGRRYGNQSHPPSICMVPSVLRGVSPSSYNPRMVSLGPLHREDKNLKEFEVRKDAYLHDLLHRVDSPPQQTIEAFVKKVNESIDRIKACYAELKTYDDIELATIMVKDCCFILEFFYKLPKLQKLQKSFVSCIVVDLMLLENQIPFFILQDILECTSLESNPSTFLTKKVLQLRKYIDPFHKKLNTTNVVTYTNPDHILGLLHKSYHLESASNELKGFPKSPTPHTAMELNRAGVIFKPNKKENWPMAIKYESSWFMCLYQPWGKPSLTLPKLHIQNGTEIVLRNFIAYEQSFQIDQYFTSYLTAMDMLVDTQEDVDKLVESEVVVNDLGSNEEAAKVINDICKEVYITTFSYNQQWKELDSYYKGYWPKNIAWLRRTYFGSPWNAIAFLAGIILFALTVVQTVYTIEAG